MSCAYPRWEMDMGMHSLSYSLQSTAGLWPVRVYPGSAVLWLLLRAHGLASRPQFHLCDK